MRSAGSVAVRSCRSHEWLLVCADGGGSNSSRGRAWKAELAGLVARTGLHITVCHYPPGTSKWNKIEHRLFSHISMNWRGKPLTSHEVVVDLIAATTTRTGLTVHAEIDNGTYATAVQVSKQDFDALPHQPSHLPPKLELHDRTDPNTSSIIYGQTPTGGPTMP